MWTKWRESLLPVFTGDTVNIDLPVIGLDSFGNELWGQSYDFSYDDEGWVLSALRTATSMLPAIIVMGCGVLKTSG